MCGLGSAAAARQYLRQVVGSLLCSPAQPLHCIQECIIEWPWLHAYVDVASAERSPSVQRKTALHTTGQHLGQLPPAAGSDHV